MYKKILFGTYIFLLTLPLFCQKHNYPWLPGQVIENQILDIPAPDHYQRISYMGDTFQQWLRALPLKPDDHEGTLYNGKSKCNQSAHYSILNIDVGTRNLQQCADAVIRLHAEFHYSKNQFNHIIYSFTNEEPVPYRKWINGYRPRVRGNRVFWTKTATPDSSYKTFRSYLDMIFTYAGSFSLSKELLLVSALENIRIGDVFIHGGFPGHAVIVVDVAAHRETGKKIFLLAQSYMPAQEIHILKNPINNGLNPWYQTKEGESLNTPEWTFQWSDLKRFTDH